MDDAVFIELQRALGRIEGKMDQMVANQVTLKSENDATKIELSKLRARVNWFGGGAAAALFLVSTFRDQLVAIFTHLP